MPKLVLLAAASTAIILGLAETSARLFVKDDPAQAYNSLFPGNHILQMSNDAKTEEINLIDRNLVKLHSTELNHVPKRPHPYLGYTFNSAMDSRVNREGFLDPHKVPHKKQPDEYVIGIFGGSVAVDFANIQFDKEKRLRRSLATILKATVPFLKNKKIVLRSYAGAAYKQPQQFFAAALFMDTLDMAITIDGANDVSGPTSQHFPLYFPHYSNLFFSQDPLVYKKWGDLIDIRQKQFAWTHFIKNNRFLRSSALVYLVWRAYMNIKHQQMRDIQENFVSEIDQDTPYYADNEVPTNEQAVKEKVKIWERYLRYQHLLLKHRGIPHFFFIQPNQYVEGSKPLSAEEKSLYYKPEVAPYNIAAGYEKLIQTARKLAGDKLPVFDLTQIFSGRRETLYSDYCCHYNIYGYNIIEEAIARRIAQSIIK